MTELGSAVALNRMQANPVSGILEGKLTPVLGIKMALLNDEVKITEKIRNQAKNFVFRE